MIRVNMEESLGDDLAEEIMDSAIYSAETKSVTVKGRFTHFF